ncbi:hypothetical protein GQX74_006534 [Glossina fuscipes]|nr:hypothetical protein GQX74_006534 [Glossina fuscipes]
MCDAIETTGMSYSDCMQKSHKDNDYGSGGRRNGMKDGEEEEEEEIYNYFKFLHNYTRVLTDMTILTTLLTSTRKYSMLYKGLSSLTYTLSMGNNERLLRTIGKGTSRDEDQDEDEDEKQREIRMKQVCEQVLRLWATLQELIARIVYYANDWLLRSLYQE